MLKYQQYETGKNKVIKLIALKCSQMDIYNNEKKSKIMRNIKIKVIDMFFVFLILKISKTA